MTFDHQPHPHIEGRKLVPPAKVHDQHRDGSGVGRFNKRTAITITAFVGTMWCAYLFTALALISAPAAFGTGNTIVIVSWIAQTFLQLVLLSVILLGQNLQAAAADKRADATYRDAEAVLHEAGELERHLEHQDELLARLLDAIVPADPPLKRAGGRRVRRGESD